MIDLFHPPKIQHKNAVKVKGYASLGDKAEMSFNHWLKKKAKSEEKKVERENLKLERVAELRLKMIEARKNYASVFEKYELMRTEMLKARREMENRIRSYKRASV